MIDTDLKIFEKELVEEIDLFGKKEDYNIRHRFKESEGKFINTITVNGQTYAYGNLVNITNDERGLIKKRLIKRYAKLSLYKALSKFTGKELPWGSLTGIRPTKMAYSELETNGEFVEFFTDTMKVSEEKTKLIESVLNAQKGIYCKDEDNTDFFVFIPFCPSRCRYCSFITQNYKDSISLVDEYVDTLIKDISESKKFIKKLRSIYIGGGTPVALTDKQLDRVLCALDDISGNIEYTVEAGRPDRITKENLKILKDHGVNRICVNPQTFNDKTLVKIGRNHTSEDVLKAYDLAKNDFSVNMDLIAGLDGESLEDFIYTLDKTKSLSPDAITVHTLCVKRGSYLSEKEDRVNVEDISKMVDYAKQQLTESEYMPYYLYRQKYMAGNLENVGYSKKGKACIYNVDTMEEISNCVACGANAISKKINFVEDRIERCDTPKDVKSYIEKYETCIKQKEKLFYEM